MLFEAQPTITTKVNALLRHTATMNRGDFLSLEDIERVAKLTRREGHWSAVLGRFRRDLLETRGIVLHSEPGVGYYLATLEQQIIIRQEARFRKTARRHGRGIKDLEEIRPSSLNHHNSNIRAQIIEEHRQSRADARIRTRLVRSLRATRDTKKHATD